MITLRLMFNVYTQTLYFQNEHKLNVLVLYGQMVVDRGTGIAKEI